MITDELTRWALAAPAEYRPALLERVDVDRAHLVTFRLLPDDAGGP